jgi:hypothetical protein
MMLVSIFLVLEQQMLESQDVVRWHTIPATPPQLRRTIAEEGHVNANWTATRSLGMPYPYTEGS